MRPLVLAFAIGIALFAPSAAAAAPRELRYDTAVDGTITAAGGLLWITSELLKPSIVPSSCRWCDRNPDGSDALNGVDASVRSALRTSPAGGADVASSVLGFVGLPALLLGTDALMAQRDGGFSGWSADVLVIAEAAIVSADVNQAAKFAFVRERPFVHALTPDQKATTPQPADNNVSFFSGHTTVAFALATATGTVATMRGYRGAEAIWAIGMPLAALTGYLRIAADKHYFADVVSGALVGAGIGFALPYFFHRPRAEASGVSVSPVGGAGLNGLSVSGTF